MQTVGRRCCKSLTTKDSLRESTALNVVHEQAISRPLSHDELVELQRVAQEAGISAHLARHGSPAVFSDAAIQFCLSVKVLFKLVAIGAPSVRAAMAARQTAGMVASLLRLAGLVWPVPDFFTLCRRQKILAVQVPAGERIGWLTYQALLNRDIALIQSTVFVIAAVVMLTNLLVDLLYMVIDPRIRLN